MRIYPWGKLPACLFRRIRRLEAHATVRNQSPLALARLGLDRRRHRSLAPANQRVLSVGVNLVSLQFRMLTCRGQADRSPARIDLLGNLEASLGRVAEQLLHHANHVFVRMVIVIPKDDVISRLLFRLLPFLFPRFDTCVLLGLSHRSVAVFGQQASLSARFRTKIRRRERVGNGRIKPGSLYCSNPIGG